jgi:hypothetical protein
MIVNEYWKCIKKMNKLVRIKLTEEEKALLKKLRDSITPETKKEWGRNEMISNIKDDYAPHPEAKGYTDIK